MIIYKITNLKTNKIYVGLTSVSLRERWTNHKSNCKNPAKYTSALYCSMRKHGIENFKIEQIDTAETLGELNIKEQTYIKALNSLVPTGYNLDDGGGSQNCHPETRAKISAALKGRPIKNRMNGAPKGRPVSPERRTQISATMTGVAQPWKYKVIIAVETGVEYESINAAAKILNMNRVTISSLLKSGKQGRLGLSFKLKEIV
jgi:group I intron endonuclease